MELTRRTFFVYGLVAAVWLLVLGWQIEEHQRVREAAMADLKNRSVDIANTVSAIIRGMRFRGAIPKDNIESVLHEMVSGPTNDVSRELLSIALLNIDNVPVASAGPQRDDLLQEREHWGRNSVFLVNQVDLGASLSSETVILPSPNEIASRTNDAARASRREPLSTNAPSGLTTNSAGRGLVASSNAPAVTASGIDGSGERPREGRFRPPPWLLPRRMTEAEYQEMIEKRTVHGLALTLSTQGLEAASTGDLWLRGIIMLLATFSVVGSGLAWRNLATSSDLQIRLVRASELNSHLKEMNLAAAGLAHETRNPLNIIRGLAQMISKQPESTPPVRQKSREIIDQADRVAAQLNEFINYSRPREVRRSALSVGAVFNEVARALNYDLEEKKIRLQIQGEQLRIEADEQLLRQALFNLILNAIQSVNGSGEIKVVAQRMGASEALLEVCDNGPGVPPDQRSEIFKPYFTTRETGTGLGLAVVQQIVQAHGWEIECLPNTPTGAVFRLSHVKLASA